MTITGETDSSAPSDQWGNDRRRYDKKKTSHETRGVCVGGGGVQRFE